MEKKISHHVAYHSVNGFWFCLFGFFKSDTKLSIFFNLCIGLMMEQCLGEKPHQRKTNKSELFEAVYIVGHFRETVV